MSIQENVQIVRDFLQQWAAAISKVCWRCPHRRIMVAVVTVLMVGGEYSSVVDSLRARSSPGS
jgi:hypothetical protein